MATVAGSAVTDYRRAYPALLGCHRDGPAPAPPTGHPTPLRPAAPSPPSLTACRPPPLLDRQPPRSSLSLSPGAHRMSSLPGKVSFTVSMSFSLSARTAMSQTETVTMSPFSPHRRRQSSSSAALREHVCTRALEKAGLHVRSWRPSAPRSPTSRFQSGPTQVEGSVQFLLNLRDIMVQSRLPDGKISTKGKERSWVCGLAADRTKMALSAKGQMKWEPPPVGWTKINVDGAYVKQTGTSALGVIARNHLGEVLFSAWRVLLRCASAVEAEA